MTGEEKREFNYSRFSYRIVFCDSSHFPSPHARGQSHYGAATDSNLVSLKPQHPFLHQKLHYLLAKEPSEKAVLARLSNSKVRADSVVFIGGTHGCAECQHPTRMA
jgi:hypothetical protein